ncbi:MAG: ATP-binding cassette domain-containing protein [Actinomycetaceae bacterium]|nr:ATP-binding cassette domain-containing protein [Actinomycetaceae bacterium]
MVKPDPMVSLASVSFSYGRRQVLHDIDLAASRGVTGIVGPNGAGKTTLLSVISTLRRARSGSVTICGHDVNTRTGMQAARDRLGVLPQSFRLVPHMRVADTIAYAAWSHGVPSSEARERAGEAAELLEISDLLEQRVGRLSGGQRQRVGIAATIAHRPEVLVLDEPTVGLDPEIRMGLRSALKEIGRETCVILSTHLIEDVAILCDKMVVISQGHVRYTASPKDLESQVNVEFAGDQGVMGSPLELAYLAVLSKGAV